MLDAVGQLRVSLVRDEGREREYFGSHFFVSKRNDRTLRGMFPIDSWLNKEPLMMRVVMDDGKYFGALWGIAALPKSKCTNFGGKTVKSRAVSFGKM
jgi:hypothetical protein